MLFVAPWIGFPHRSVDSIEGFESLRIRLTVVPHVGLQLGKRELLREIENVVSVRVVLLDAFHDHRYDVFLSQR